MKSTEERVSRLYDLILQKKYDAVKDEMRFITYDVFINLIIKLIENKQSDDILWVSPLYLTSYSSSFGLDIAVYHAASHGLKELIDPLLKQGASIHFALTGIGRFGDVSLCRELIAKYTEEKDTKTIKSYKEDVLEGACQCMQTQVINDLLSVAAIDNVLKTLKWYRQHAGTRDQLLLKFSHINNAELRASLLQDADIEERNVDGNYRQALAKDVNAVHACMKYFNIDFKLALTLYHNKDIIPWMVIGKKLVSKQQLPLDIFLAISMFITSRPLNETVKLYQAIHIGILNQKITNIKNEMVKALPKVLTESVSAHVAFFKTQREKLSRVCDEAEKDLNFTR